MPDFPDLSNFQQGPDPMKLRQAQIQMQNQYKALLKKGLSPEQADLVMRGSVGALEPGEEEAFTSILQQLMGQGRYEARAGMIPGMQQGLQAWPPGAQSAADKKAAIWRSLMGGEGGGGGGELRLRDLMR